MRSFIFSPSSPLLFVYLSNFKRLACKRAFAVVLAPMNASSWSCSQCTFLNSPSQNPSSCKICLAPFSSSCSSSSTTCVANWSCKACTFSNKPSSLSCEVCETLKETKPMNNFSTFKDFGLDQDELSDPSIGKVFLPLKQCTGRKRPAPSPEKPNDSGSVEKKGLFLRPCSSKSQCTLPETIDEVTVWDSGEIKEKKTSKKNKIKVMSYNVWFREDLELIKRIQAIGNLILLHKPDFICLQEITPNIYSLFQSSYWWKDYQCSVSRQLAQEMPYFCMLMSKFQVKSFKTMPFSNSIMGRELCTAQIILPDSKTLTLATSHLESPCPAPPTWNQMFSKERVEQARLSLNLLEASSDNVIFAGDMNWDDKSDGPYPLSNNWADVWAQLRPNEEGFSYDTKENKMLSGNRSLRKRLDRVLCKCADFEAIEIEMIGREEIEGVKYFKEKKVKKEMKMLELPVLPSDHFGLLATFVKK